MLSNNDPGAEKKIIKVAKPTKNFRLSCRYSKRKYQFVLARVLFCAVKYEDAAGRNCACLYFYKDGTCALEGASNLMLNEWLLTSWPKDFNVAFWELREAVRVQGQLEKGYSFSYDAGLQLLIAYD